MPVALRTPVRIAALAGVALALLVPATPASSADASAAPAASRSGDTVVVKTFRFRPATIEVTAGSKVVWRNRDKIEHTVTGGDAASETLDGTLRRAGSKYAVRFADPGTYEYFCARHASMTGTVVVR